MGINTVEVFEVRCDAFSKGCLMACAYDSETSDVALARARVDGWRVYGSRPIGYRFKCPACVEARAKLERR